LINCKLITNGRGNDGRDRQHATAADVVTTVSHNLLIHKKVDVTRSDGFHGRLTPVTDAQAIADCSSWVSVMRAAGMRVSPAAMTRRGDRQG
jgi:hypothetical protein